MKKKKYKLRKKRIFLALIILITIITFLFNASNIFSYIKLRSLNYDNNTIKLIKDNNLMIDKYSKTLENIIDTKYFILDNTSLYIDIDYIEKEDFFININKLISIGYNTNEINKILELEDISIILNNNYNKNILEILNNPYFVIDNLERYLNYDKDSIVLNVNMNLDYEFYNHDILLEEVNTLSIVNKYYKLDKTYIPSLVTIDRKYAVNNNQKVISEVKEYFERMCEDALKEDIHIYSGSAYRSYSYQNTLYNNRVTLEGLDYANKTAAKAGYSEHQTGMAIDVMNKNYDYLSSSDIEYNYLIENSYKYGFILRYPSDKEDITGYSYEPWHFRYVTIEVATYLKENNLTYEEYIGMNLNK